MKTVYYNGIVYTGEEHFREAFLVQDGTFAAVGDNTGILALSDAETERIDLGGSFVCPGFNDSHMHILNFGRSLLTAQLGSHTQSLQEMLRYLREYADENPPSGNGWLVSRGWNQDYFTDTGRMPDRHDLDTVSTAYPILVTRACGHACVVNSKALEIAGIDASTVSPEGGAIGMEYGRPDGRLYDNAMEL
ncbi:MAG: amidohydrolase family protein, partial [Lachnospiraceae bacterium]|nr:amidohydrolase family protein [Lachnospiraceae bacterium]